MSETIDQWEFQVGDPLIGWRTWKIEERHGLALLASTYIATRWPRRRVMTARCYERSDERSSRIFSPDHEIPSPPRNGDSHACGIYAVKYPNLAEKWFPTVGGPEATRVVGQVALWGRIRKYQKGYQAQFAYPKALVTLYAPKLSVKEAMRLADELTEGYGVPLDTIQIGEALIPWAA